MSERIWWWWWWWWSYHAREWAEIIAQSCQTHGSVNILDGIFRDRQSWHGICSIACSPMQHAWAWAQWHDSSKASSCNWFLYAMIGTNIVYNSINKHAKVPLFIVTTPVPNLSALSEWIQPTRCFLFWTFRPVTQVFTYSTYSYPQEWAAASRDECLCHPHPPQCAFGDIGQFLQPALQATLKDLKGGELLQSKLKPLVEKGLAVKPPLVIHVRIRLLAFLASSSINNQSLLIIFNDRIIHWSMVAMIVVALRNHDSESMESLPWVYEIRNPISRSKSVLLVLTFVLSSGKHFAWFMGMNVTSRSLVWRTSIVRGHLALPTVQSD